MSGIGTTPSVDATVRDDEWGRRPARAGVLRLTAQQEDYDQGYRRHGHGPHDGSQPANRSDEVFRHIVRH
jgi:hypothetical protein